MLGLSSISTTEKTCRVCGESKPLAEFEPRGRRCCECRREYFRNRYHNKPGVKAAQKASSDAWLAKNPSNRLGAWLKHAYGMTLEEYAWMLNEQDCLCAICRMPSKHPKNDRLWVDHHHKNNKVRALLCHKCNSGIGQFDEDIERMQAAIEYLKKHNAND